MDNFRVSNLKLNAPSDRLGALNLTISFFERRDESERYELHPDRQ